MNTIIKAYLTLKIDTKTFVQAVLADGDLYDELNRYLPTAGMETDEKWRNFPYMLSLRTHGFDLKRTIQGRFSNGTTPSGKSGLYDFIHKLMVTNGEEVEYNEYYRNRFRLLMDIVPDYVGGDAAEEYIDSFISSIPCLISTEQKKQMIKKIIKSSFLCKGKIKPKWAQEPQWPVNDKPLMFVSQSKDGDKYTYTFEDVDTGKKIEIVQYA